MAKFHFNRRLSDDEVKHWQERTQLGTSLVRKSEHYWDEAIQRYANRHLQGDDGDGPRVSVNVLLSNIRSKLPFLFYQNPEILVRPKRPNAPKDLGAVAQSLSMYYLKENDAEDKINRAILDALLQSRGIVKVGYSTRTVSNQPKPKKGGDPSDPYFGKKGGRPRKEASAVDHMPPMRITMEGPVLSHVSPRRFITHPDARFPIDEGARWVGHISKKPIDLVRIDNRFDEAWRKKLQPTERHRLDVEIPGFDSDKMKDPSSQFVMLYEIWDKTRREVMVFAEGNFEHGPARVRNWPFTGMPGFPFQLYVPLEVPETFEAMTELDPIIYQVEEMDHFRTMQARHLQRFKRFYEVTDDNMDKDELDKLRVREDGDYAITGREDGQRAIHPVEDAQIPVDAFQFIAEIRNDIDVVSGVSELRRSGQGTSKTATEASIVDQVQQARGVFDRKMVDKFVKGIVVKQFQVMQQWLPEDLTIEITGPIGTDWVSNVSPKMIEGQFDFEIVPGSTIPPNTQLMRAEVGNLVAILQRNPFFQNLVDWREVLLMVLETFPELVRGGRKEKIVKDQSALPQQQGLPGAGQGAPGGADPVQALLAGMGGANGA